MKNTLAYTISGLLFGGGLGVFVFLIGYIGPLFMSRYSPLITTEIGYFSFLAISFALPIVGTFIGYRKSKNADQNSSLKKIIFVGLIPILLFVLMYIIGVSRVLLKGNSSSSGGIQIGGEIRQ